VTTVLASTVAAASLGIAYELALLKADRGTSLGDTVAFFFEDTSVVDELSPRFRQHAQNTCGAAVLAFVLTRMSDLVSESELVAAKPPAMRAVYSLDELRALARSRGSPLKASKEHCGGLG
jgi:hypothetical protein